MGAIAAEAVVLAGLFGLPGDSPVPFLAGLALVFLLPGLIAGVATGPLAGVLGGRFGLKRSLFLSVTAGAIPIPLALVWRIAAAAVPTGLPQVAAVLLFLQAPVLWLREMSLFGVSNPSHARTLPAALLAPVLSILGTFAIFPPTSSLVLESVLFLLVGFLASALLLRAADRPMRREFATSGVALIRPMLDHINSRDPQATEALEEFFSRFSALADLSVSLITFTGEKGRKATIALPTVHPGPFGALGSSDLPRRLSEWLGPKAGTVFVPHTPCNHDLDLPSRREFERVASETEALLGEIPTGPSPSAPRASPLIAGTPTSLARVQILGDVALVLVTQAPGPTDDIDFSVVDPLAKRLAETTGLRLALIDAHNSYIEGQGDLTYGTPMARRLARDLEASLDRARQCLADGPIRAGIGVKDGYSLGRDGIGPAGIRT
ncbi:MAG TPA: DUF2070 family protein, partial [Thermoplasmata archaeon]|nr:DUF2070 family protein [Thermoplasmata archaeon]